MKILLMDETALPPPIPALAEHDGQPAGGTRNDFLQSEDDASARHAETAQSVAEHNGLRRFRSGPCCGSSRHSSRTANRDEAVLRKVTPDTIPKTLTEIRFLPISATFATVSS
ncbi:MAG: hypothetical protein IPJ82_24350 [Lewinellaceae bacterium]|nr:hypothetical protein [Lewinellaceae bacterium]